MTLEPLLTQDDVDRKQRFLTREGGAARPLRWNDAGYWVCQDGDSDCVFAAYPDGTNYYGHRQYDLISRIPPEPASEAMNKTDRCRTCGHEYDEHGYMDENDEGEFENPACHHFFLDGHRACGCKQFIPPEPDMESQVVAIDGRKQKADPRKQFKELGYGDLYEADSHLIYRKLDGKNAERLTGPEAPQFAFLIDTYIVCLPRPDLRLRMILEDRA